VRTHLDALGIRSLCLDQITLWEETVTFDPVLRLLRVGEHELTSCSVVWNRRAYPTAIEFMSRGEKKFARSEFAHALFGGLHALDPAWFNSPGANQRASYKAVQLRWAAADGRLRVPRTTITSSGERARAFVTAARTRFVVKPLYRPMVETDEGFFAVHTTLIGADISENLADIRHSPCIVQEFVERRYDVRVNLIGDAIFATRLDTAHIAAAAIDSRLVPDYHDIVHTPIDLPNSIARACTAMCDHFGLRFGAFDFALDAHGEWFFLELNPNGQWYWIEEMTGQPLSAAMASEIARQIERRAKPERAQFNASA
jgi:glutathione synthase/RimK-type ligase-like ATP-grasp enzyme